MLVIDRPVSNKSIAENLITENLSTEKKYSEKRSFIRMKTGAQLSAKLDTKHKQIEGLCLDLSGSGLQVSSPEFLTVGTEIDVEVSSGRGHNPTLRAHAKIIRTTPNGPSSYLLGMEILQMM
jgi:PilZ domain